MTSDSELFAALVAHDQVRGAVVNVSLRRTRKKNGATMQSAGPRGAHKWSASLRMHAAVQSRFVYRALATQLRALPVVATRFVLMGVLWLTWQLQSLGTAASSPARVDAVKWLERRPPVRQTGRDLEELHYVVVDAATFAAVVFTLSQINIICT